MYNFICIGHLHWTSHAIIPLLYDKESWVLKNWCSWSVVLEKTLESPLDCKEIQPVNATGNQSWIFIGRSDAEAPILWPPDAKNWLIGKGPDAGKDWRKEEKVMTEDEVVRWHHWLDGYEFEQALVVGDGQGSLACCSPWGRKELDMIHWLNWTHASKVMFKILHACLQHYANQEIPDVQAGIRKGRGTRDQIANICCIIEKAREYKKKKKKIYLCFFDYTKAFNGVNYNKLWIALKAMGIPDHVTCILRDLHVGQEATVRTLDGTAGWFKIEKGIWQDCLLCYKLKSI